MAAPGMEVSCCLSSTTYLFYTVVACIAFSSSNCLVLIVYKYVCTFFILGSRSTFYEADTCQEAIYEDASKLQRQTSPTYSDHIYEEIPECKQTADQQQPEQQRPLPPIPEAQTKSDNG